MDILIKPIMFLNGKNYPIKKLEELLSFQFLPRLDFESLSERKTVRQKCLEKEKKEQEIVLGKRYQKEIEASWIINSSIQWISESAGYGLFANQIIEESSYVGEYTGLVRRNNRRYSEPLNNYCYEYPISDSYGRSYVIDASQGHFTRFINHSNQPNLLPRYAYCNGFFHLIFLSSRQIEKGEQLTYDYGASYWYLRSPPELF